MTFSYSLATDIGKIRLLINDKVNTSDEQAQFSDEELQIFLTSGGSVKLGAAEALEAWAAGLTGEVDSEHIGDYSYTKKAIANKLDMASRYRASESDTPAFEWAEFNLTGEEE